MNEGRWAIPYQYHEEPREGCEDMDDPPRDCFLWSAPTLESHKRSVDKLALFHYAVKSREDFRIKHQRGGGGNSPARDEAFFQKVARCARRSACTAVTAFCHRVIAALAPSLLCARTCVMFGDAWHAAALVTY